jgi:hypothetical protein
VVVVVRRRILSREFHKIREEECHDEDDDDVVENLVMRGSCCVGFVFFLSFFCGSSIAGRAGGLAGGHEYGRS